MRSPLLDFSLVIARSRHAALPSRFGIPDRDGRASRPVEAACPALALWRALRDCPDLRCRFSTPIGFLAACGPLIPAHVCRPADAAVLTVRTAGWSGVDVAPHLGRSALHVSSPDGVGFLRATPGAALSRARWAACLRLAEALPVAPRLESVEVFAPFAPAGSPPARALPRFFRNLANVEPGCVVTVDTTGLRVRYPLRVAHVACDDERLLVADARSEVVLQLNLGKVAEVRREADEALVLLDGEGREAMTVRSAPDDAEACARTWSAVSRHYFPRR
jgi:hypothetical protein